MNAPDGPVTVELFVERLSKSGDGVAQHEGRAVFVSGALPGERVRAELEAGSKAQRAIVTSLLEPSPLRRAPPCALAEVCGGCDWMQLSDEAQLQQKEEIVFSALEHLGGIERGGYHRVSTERSPLTVGYRRRAVLHPVRGALGFNGRRSHQRIPIAHCPALTEPLQRLPGALVPVLSPMLKDLEEVRLLECDGLVSLSLHLKGALRGKYETLAQTLVRDGLVDGVVLQPGEGAGPAKLVGAPVLEDDGVLHRPDAFAQANAAVNRRLVAQAVEFLHLTGKERVLELYAGNGNFTFRIADHAAQVVAVESFGVSLSLAERAASKRKVDNVRFVLGDSEKIASGLAAEAERFDALLIDPPRSGAPGVGSWASKLLVKRVVYVACDPTSLARDAKELGAHGFAPVALQLFDLFPQTHHIEALMVFER